MPKPLTVAVVGATGVVGRTMIQVLNEREFPVGEMRLLASGRSAGRSVRSTGGRIEIGEATADAFDGVDIALFSAGADVSRELAPEAAAARRDGHRQLVARGGWTRRSRSSCSRSTRTTSRATRASSPTRTARRCSAPVLMALRDTVGLERVVVDTYQSVSGTGGEAIAELEGQIRAHVAGEPKRAAVYPHPIAFNALPEIDVFLPNGYTKEEWKVVTENRKILRLPDLRISCTAVRIPVFVEPFGGGPRRDARADHARNVRASCSPPCRASSSRTIPRRTTIRSRPRPPAATRSSSGGSARTRRSPDGRGLAFWVVSDNLRKGAATNAVEIAEVLVARDWVTPASARGARAVPRPGGAASGGTA